MDIYGNNPTTKEGEYFRSNIWGWPPILNIALAANEIHGLDFDMSSWSYNDGAGLETQEDCNRLADAMESILGLEDEVLKAEHSDTAKALMKVFGGGSFSSQAQTSKEHAKEFVTFLRTCGGFKIC